MHTKLMIHANFALLLLLAAASIVRVVLVSYKGNERVAEEKGVEKTNSSSSQRAK